MNPQEQNYWQGDEGIVIQPSAATPETPEAKTPVAPTQEPIAWEASEYIHHQNSFMWYLVCIGLGIVLTLLSFFLLRAWSFSFLILVITAAIVIYGRRPPRNMSYQLTTSTLHINESSYDLHDFRSFGVVQEEAFYSIVLIPTKRFMPAINLYFPAEAGEQIVDRLGSILPMEVFEPDFIDRFVKKIRF
jgi:hypothetical protein